MWSLVSDREESNQRKGIEYSLPGQVKILLRTLTSSDLNIAAASQPIWLARPTMCKIKVESHFVSVAKKTSSKFMSRHSVDIV